jgi:uncharacterized protein (TIGR03083 family)
MKIGQHIEALRREGLLLADAAAHADWDASVPTCPEWRLRDLVRHTGCVHRWATRYVTDGLTTMLSETGEQEAWGPPPADAALLDWFREGHQQLVSSLTQAPADLECWSFLPAPSPLAFWARRQAHETAIHRVDAEAAAAGSAPQEAGAVSGPLPGDFALDGIDELLCGFLARPVSMLHTDRPRTLLVHATDAGEAGGCGDWMVSISKEPAAVARRAGPADCVVSGTAAELYLLLWNRLPPENADACGDLSLFQLWRETAQIRWS